MNQRFESLLDCMINKGTEWMDANLMFSDAVEREAFRDWVFARQGGRDD